MSKKLNDSFQQYLLSYLPYYHFEWYGIRFDDLATANEVKAAYEAAKSDFFQQLSVHNLVPQQFEETAKKIIRQQVLKAFQQDQDRNLLSCPGFIPPTLDEFTAKINSPPEGSFLYPYLYPLIGLEIAGIISSLTIGILLISSNSVAAPILCAFVPSLLLTALLLSVILVSNKEEYQKKPKDDLKHTEVGLILPTP